MASKLFFSAILYLLSIAGFGQFNHIESKDQALEALNHKMADSNRQNLYNYLGKLYLIRSWTKHADIDSAFYYLRKAVYLSDSVNTFNNEITNESLCVLAQAYIFSGNYMVGKKICMQVIRNYQKYNQKMNEADTWRMMGEELWIRNSEDPFIQSYFDSAINLCDQMKQVGKKAAMRIKKINYFSATGKTETAEAELQKLLREAGENKFENLSEIYILLSYEERYKGNLNKGLEYSLEAVKYLDKAKDKSQVHNCYGELAQIYEELGEAEKSVYWYKKCIAERENKSFSKYVIYRTMSLMVIQMIKAKKEGEALELLKQLAKRNPPTGLVERASLAQSLAYCYTAMKQYNRAETKFLEMLNYYSAAESNRELLHIAYYDVGKFYVDLRQFAKAEAYLKNAIEHGESTLLRTKDLHLLLFKVDSANGNLATAIKHFQNYKTLNDSIFNATKSKQIEELMIKYSSEKKDQDIKLLENESKLQQGELVQANQTRNWILGVAILLFIIVGLLINNSRNKQKANKKLEVQQREIRQQNISLQHLVIEKDWLVKEIHHRVKNNFHMVMGLLGTQSGYLKSQEAIGAIKESQHRVHAMSLIHQKLYQSDNLSAINMTDYIHELVDYLRDSFNIRHVIQFNLQVERIELDLSHCIPLGLILNEAITNSIKYAFSHSKEKIIAISFKYVSEYHLLLTVSDNGVGLPSGFNCTKTNSMGLNLMQGLSDDIEAKFTINSLNGTQITIAFVYDSDITKDVTQI